MPRSLAIVLQGQSAGSVLDWQMTHIKYIITTEAVDKTLCFNATNTVASTKKSHNSCFFPLLVSQQPPNRQAPGFFFSPHLTLVSSGCPVVFPSRSFAPNCLSGKRRKPPPHLIQKSFGFVFGQQAQTRGGLQDHRGPAPLLLWHRLLGNLQQLSDGVSTLRRGEALVRR